VRAGTRCRLAPWPAKRSLLFHYNVF
jgi:hypothetical protein